MDPTNVSQSSLQPLLKAVTSICLILIIVGISLRTYTKLYIIKTWGLEDCRFFDSIDRMIGSLLIGWCRCQHCRMGEQFDPNFHLQLTGFKVAATSHTSVIGNARIRSMFQNVCAL